MINKQIANQIWSHERLKVCQSAINAREAVQIRPHASAPVLAARARRRKSNGEVLVKHLQPSCSGLSKLQFVLKSAYYQKN